MTPRYKVHRSIRKRTLQVTCLKTGAISFPIDVFLKDLTFHVDPAGQAEMRGSGQRTVHAWIEAEITTDDLETTHSVDYNPLTDETFVQRGTSLPIWGASYGKVNANGAMQILNPKFSK